VSELTPINLSTLSPALNVTMVTDSSGLAKVKDFFSRTTEFVVDTETNVTKDINLRKVRLIQVGNKEEQYLIDMLAFAGSTKALCEQGGFVAPSWASDIVECLQPVLDGNSHLKIGVGLDFDYQMFSWNLGIQMWNVYDCHLVEKVIYTGRVNFMMKGFWGMKDMVGRYCRVAISKAEQTSFDLESPLTPEQIAYGALDCRLPLSIRSAQLKLVASSNLQRTVDIENAAIPSFNDMHLYGFYLCPERWLAIVEATEKEHEANIKELDKHFLPLCGTGTEPKEDLVGLEEAWKNEKSKEVKASYRQQFYAARRAVKAWEKGKTTWQGEAAINYSAPASVLKALCKAGYTKEKLKSTDEQCLKLFKKDPIIAVLLEYRGTEKSLTSYGRAYIEKHISLLDGRVHSDFSQLGAATGRTSSAKPNLQNLPKGSTRRKCFMARPGYVLITADYNGCELRILAELSGEQSWIDAFNKGWDVHSVGAEILFGDEWKNAADPDCAYYKDGAHQKCECKKHKALRDKVKALNFGIAYGMEHKKLSEDLSISIDDAKALLALYRKTFAKVTAYLKLSGESAKQNFESRTICGRRRLYSKPDRDSSLKIATERRKKDGLEGPATFHDIQRAIRSMMGSIEREGKNTPIQGTNADIIKWAMGCGLATVEGSQLQFPFLWHQLREYGAFIVNMVHDELVVECPEDCAEEVKQIVETCMERAGADFVKSVRMIAEAAVSVEWSK
jgi:DNA polymerase-1